MTSKVCKSLVVFSFLFNLSRRYGLLPQSGGLGGDGALMQTDAVRLNSHEELKGEPMVPDSIEVEVPEEVLAYLQRISDRTGQSISEIAAAMVIEGAERLNS